VIRVWRPVRVRARRSEAFTLLLVVSVGLLLPNVVILEVAADIAIVSYVNEGVVISSNNETMMPTANVSIKALVTGSFAYDVTSNCTFSVISNSTLNCSVAFAYPRAYLSMGPTTLYDSSLTVYVDSVQTSHVDLNWTDLQTGFQTNLSDIWGLEECSFAVFNITLNADEACTVQVDQTLHLVSSYYTFDFKYAIGTGRYWAGNTSETVRIEVEDRAGLLGLTFYPQPNRTENPAESTTVAVWSCSVDYFDSFWVGFTAKQYEYHGLYPPVPLWYWLALVGIAAVPCIVAVFLLFRRQNAPF
jgi:hypothetical protein